MKTILVLAVALGAMANEFDLDCYADVCAVDADTDDDTIREESHRRDEFDKQHKKALMRLLTRPAAREVDRDWQRKRVAAEAAQEITRRMAFDENHPRIYKTAAERQQAYAIFHPAMALKDRSERPNLKVFDPPA